LVLAGPFLRTMNLNTRDMRLRASLLFVVLLSHYVGSVHGLISGLCSSSSFFSIDSSTDHDTVVQQRNSELVNDGSNNDGRRRRLILVSCISLSTTTMWPVEDAIAALPGFSLFGGSNNNRRQLELCLVTILRRLYNGQVK
jgi:hypothetical protein